MKKPITGLFLASAIFAAFTAQAIPAKRGLSDFRQPDGSTVKVTLNGDENCHYYLSEDGLPLTTDSEGYLRYTSIAADRTPRSGCPTSGIRHRPRSRNQSHTRACRTLAALDQIPRNRQTTRPRCRTGSFQCSRRSAAPVGTRTFRQHLSR